MAVSSDSPSTGSPSDARAGPARATTRDSYACSASAGVSRRIARSPIREMRPMAGPLARAATASGGAPLRKRLAGLGGVTAAVGRAAADEYGRRKDPVNRTRRKLSKDEGRLRRLEEEVEEEIQQAVSAAMATA